MKRSLLSVVVVLLVAAAAQADTVLNGSGAAPGGIVVPDNVYGGEPFTFSVPQISGEDASATIQLQTSGGAIVSRTPRTDKYGRVFVAAGLPAGAYFVTIDAKKSRAAGRFEVAPRSSSTEPPANSLRVVHPPALQLNAPFALQGSGFSADFSHMHVRVSNERETVVPNVLAASGNQMKLEPLHIRPGEARLTVENSSTGLHTPAVNVFLYDVKARLERNTLPNGVDRSQFTIDLQPADTTYNVRVTVTNGNADFGDGKKEAHMVTHDGHAVFRVYAGRGPFNIIWDVDPVLDESTETPSPH